MEVSNCLYRSCLLITCIPQLRLVLLNCIGIKIRLVQALGPISRLSAKMTRGEVIDIRGTKE